MHSEALLIVALGESLRLKPPGEGGEIDVGDFEVISL